MKKLIRLVIPFCVLAVSSCDKDSAHAGTDAAPTSARPHKLVSAKTPKELDDKVWTERVYGWRPLGPVPSYSGNTVFYQVLVRNEPDSIFPFTLIERENEYKND